jgi:hypothetical protein
MYPGVLPILSSPMPTALPGPPELRGAGLNPGFERGC